MPIDVSLLRPSGEQEADELLRCAKDRRGVAVGSFVFVTDPFVLVWLRRLAAMPIDVSLLRPSGAGKLLILSQSWLQHRPDEVVRAESCTLLRRWGWHDEALELFFDSAVDLIRQLCKMCCTR